MPIISDISFSVFCTLVVPLEVIISKLIYISQFFPVLSCVLSPSTVIIHKDWNKKLLALENSLHWALAHTRTSCINVPSWSLLGTFAQLDFLLCSSTYCWTWKTCVGTLVPRNSYPSGWWGRKRFRHLCLFWLLIRIDFKKVTFILWIVILGDAIFPQGRSL